MRRHKGDWARLVEEYRDSGESVKEFCESRGIHPNTFYKRRKEYRAEPLVEVPITAAATREVRPIVVRTGEYEVSVHHGFDRECLRSVLEVIGELR